MDVLLQNVLLFEKMSQVLQKQPKLQFAKENAIVKKLCSLNNFLKFCGKNLFGLHAI